MKFWIEKQETFFFFRVVSMHHLFPDLKQLSYSYQEVSDWKFLIHLMEKKILGHWLFNDLFQR